MARVPECYCRATAGAVKIKINNRVLAQNSSDYDKLSSTMLKTTFWKLLCPCRAHTTFPFLISERRKEVSIKIEKKHNPKARTPKTQNCASTDVNDTIRIHAADTLHTVSI